jgi:hypothetical protein
MKVTILCSIAILSLAQAAPASVASTAEPKRAVQTNANTLYKRARGNALGRRGSEEETLFKRDKKEKKPKEPSVEKEDILAAVNALLPLIAPGAGGLGGFDPGAPVDEMGGFPPGAEGMGVPPGVAVMKRQEGVAEPEPVEALPATNEDVMAAIAMVRATFIESQNPVPVMDPGMMPTEAGMMPGGMIDPRQGIEGPGMAMPMNPGEMIGPPGAINGPAGPGMAMPMNPGEMMGPPFNDPNLNGPQVSPQDPRMSMPVTMGPRERPAGPPGGFPATDTASAGPSLKEASLSQLLGQMNEIIGTTE